MGEDIEPMIDQEMFLQMMESMDKDGDGTVTKASHTPHARARQLAVVRAAQQSGPRDPASAQGGIPQSFSTKTTCSSGYLCGVA